MTRYRSVAATALFAAGLLAGCGADQEKPRAAVPASQTSSDDVSAERAKLSPEDSTLVEAQEWCVINSDERLGSMGPPLKLDIKGQPVFVCCKGCKKKAEADPDKTLAKVEELKAKAKAERDAKK
jgi:hypothetical protein